MAVAGNAIVQESDNEMTDVDKTGKGGAYVAPNNRATKKALHKDGWATENAETLTKRTVSDEHPVAYESTPTENERLRLWAYPYIGKAIVHPHTNSA